MKTKKSKLKINKIKTNKKSLILFLVFALLISGVGVYMLRKSSAATPQGTYTNWNWSPPANGFDSLEHSLTIESVTNDAPYFWSHQFRFGDGDGGYMGLQSHGNRVNGSVGKTVIFSIFSAGIAATPGSCSVEQAGFDGYNTSGSSCRVAYEWVQGRKYTMRTARLGSDSNGTWWGGWIMDTTTGVETFIAQIQVPPIWKGISYWSVMWTEYFGAQPATCDQLAYSRVKFYPPTANSRTISPTSTSNSLSQGTTCTNSKITNTTDGVIQEMGNSANIAPTLPPTITDLTAPIVTITQPTNNSTVTLPFNVIASASDNVGVKKIQLYVNGTLITESTSTSTINYTINDLTARRRGKKSQPHTIKVQAYDAAGNIGSKSISVYR